MILSLTRDQLHLLRRCSGGLRVWETSADLVALQAQLEVLAQLKLVAFEEQRGYEATAQGEACLVRFDP